MKRETFVAAIATLTGTFGRPLETPAIEGYWIGLQDLTDEEMATATGKAIAECKFMPVPAELRAFVRPPRNLQREAAIAWEAVRAAIDRIDYTARSVDFGPVVNACVRQAGGWDRLCEAKVSELNIWLPKEFARLYELYALTDVGEAGRPCEGGPEGRPYGDHEVKIKGIPSQPGRALPAIGDRSGDVRALVAGLAEAKSQ